MAARFVPLIMIVFAMCGGGGEITVAIQAQETEETLESNANSLERFVDELPMMPIIKGYTRAANGPLYSPANLTIGMYMKKWRFHRDLAPAWVFAYGETEAGATVPGPSIRARAGVKTYVRWENQLPRRHMFAVDGSLSGAAGGSGAVDGVPTVVHLHGGVSEPGSDGNALAWFTRGFRRTGPAWSKPLFEYANVHGTASLWYHDHAMAYTRLNLLAGLAGAYRVSDPALEHRAWKLPRARFDVDLVLMDRSFCRDGRIYINSTGDNPSIHPEWQPEYFGHAIIVNGKAWPYMKVRRRKYRFRIVNASNARFYELALDNGLEFTQIGSDSFFLEKPIRVGKILVAPSEIVDVIVDFGESRGGHAVLTNSANYPYPNGDAVKGIDRMVMKFVVIGSGRGSDVSEQVPAKLAEVQRLDPSMAATTRDIVLYEFDAAGDGKPTRLLINFKQFTDPVTETPRNGSTEAWRIINLTPDNHPFHVHLAAFQVQGQQRLRHVPDLTRCVVEHRAVEPFCRLDPAAPPEPPPPSEAGWKNVFKMKPWYVTTILVRFALPDSRPFPFDPSVAPGYTYHCHILDHEDNAMMRPYKIVL